MKPLMMCQLIEVAQHLTRGCSMAASMARDPDIEPGVRTKLLLQIMAMTILDIGSNLPKDSQVKFDWDHIYGRGGAHLLEGIDACECMRLQLRHCLYVVLYGCPGDVCARDLFLQLHVRTDP